MGAALAFAPAAVLVAVGGHPVDLSGTIHFYSVGFSALLAWIAAAGLTVVGARRGDMRTMVVSTAFVAMASLLALHGFSTPGVIFGTNGVVAITGGATLPVGALILSSSVFPLPRTITNVKPVLAVQAMLVACVFGLGALALAWPSLLPAVPASKSPEAIGLLAVGLAAFALVTTRAFRTYGLTRRPLDLAVIVGLVWLATAIVPALTMTNYQLGWWIGHELELDGIVAVGIAVAVDLARAAQSRPLTGDLTGADLVAAEDAFLGSQVRALTVTLAEKDTYTERHTRRVALRAVQVGEELGFSAGRLRTLAIGGLVHDIGKLAVPDEILKKPGPLDDDEYAVVREHAERGYRLLGELGGFSESVRALVHDHHERLDGTGYPRGLHEAELTLDTKILAVCDVYDALISKRVYRAAWSHEQAMELLRVSEREAFDQSCVEALARVVEREGEVPEPAAEPKPAPRERAAHSGSPLPSPSPVGPRYVLASEPPPRLRRDEP
ncbi:MAG TPA: HD-GYP domain-containing protein [Gaiellaceae bacterium]|nr:HD-GYP domain-containing protein [Gaiellaceae bacterium]